MPANAEPAKRPRATVFDGQLRYMVPSRRNADSYLVELGSYNGNGQCCCKHFLCRCEPLLRRSISPEDALKGGLIKLKENRHVEDALRCEHILTARAQFCDDVIVAMNANEKNHPTATLRPTPPQDSNRPRVGTPPW